jgi:hypothetical protein
MDHESLTTREALNRGLNFFGVAVLAILAASLILELLKRLRDTRLDLRVTFQAYL